MDGTREGSVTKIPACPAEDCGSSQGTKNNRICVFESSLWQLAGTHTEEIPTPKSLVTTLLPPQRFYVHFFHELLPSPFKKLFKEDLFQSFSRGSIENLQGNVLKLCYLNPLLHINVGEPPGGWFPGRPPCLFFKHGT